MLVSLTSTIITFIIVLFIPTVTDTDGIRLRVRTEKRKTWSQKSEEWEWKGGKMWGQIKRV